MEATPNLVSPRFYFTYQLTVLPVNLGGDGTSVELRSEASPVGFALALKFAVTLKAS